MPRRSPKPRRAHGRYSWLLETMVALVYGGGFIVMTPQLFINYKLKSVACLPWKFFMCALSRPRAHRSASGPRSQACARRGVCRPRAHADEH